MQFLGLEQRLAGLFEGLLGLGGIGNVAGDLGKAQQRAGVAANRIDDDVGHEARAILAHAPALLLETPFAGGDAQRALRFAGIAIFGGVEHREMLADGFGR